jgi:GH24 family phage-related lysozyme (muramidase)
MWFVLLAISAGLIAMTVNNLKARIITILSDFIPSVEGFRSHPYWDKSRYSWGYGTAAPGATGTITREQAFADMLSHLMTDYERLLPRISRSLNAYQWASLLSFSYNVGVGNAYNLVEEINAGDWPALERNMKQYVYSGGEFDPDLVARRIKEWELWNY